jgi:hypothetical protein
MGLYESVKIRRKPLSANKLALQIHKTGARREYRKKPIAKIGSAYIMEGGSFTGRKP